MADMTVYGADEPLYRLHDDGTRCNVLMTCGHWSVDHSPATSWFDFPDEAEPCAECGGADRQMDLRLQVAFSQRDEDR